MHDKPSQVETGRRLPPPHPGLGLVRATESAALAAGRWMGRGDRQGADHAAQDAMAEALDLMPMQGRIVSGEELRVGEHSRLDSGAAVGTGKGPQLDVEVNAIDGAGLVAEGRPGSMSVAAFAGPGAMWKPAPAVYMQKLVVDRRAAAALGPEALDAPAGWVLALVARQMGKEIRDLVVFLLERPYHEALVGEIRRAGARVYLRPAGDIGGAIMAADPQGGVDLMMGMGGASEGLLAACAVKALGGGMLGRVHTRDEAERRTCLDAGVEVDRVFTCADMIAGDDVFFTATGITDTPLLGGVRYHGDTVDTHSLVLRMDTGTRRLINTEHRLT
ncbi:MAG: fructose-bisphosphatase class II family protein [Krumholzibacteria bacterium]|nr:fructose-bisphosphatase class II family protein [Candidatus Krumholzibacteria bacterium]